MTVNHGIIAFAAMAMYPQMNRKSSTHSYISEDLTITAATGVKKHTEYHTSTLITGMIVLQSLPVSHLYPALCWLHILHGTQRIPA